MESWSHGVMESWSHGVVESWSHGVMDRKNPRNKIRKSEMPMPI